MMDADKPKILITGISGCLGLRLLLQLREYRITGVDLQPPKTDDPLNFVAMDLGLEQSCRELFLLMRAERPVAVIHLAVNTGGSLADDYDRMWQVNVGGAARVLEAITEVNRDEDIVKKFVVLSCALVYPPAIPQPVSEDHQLEANSFPLAIQKLESDQAIQQRAPSAKGCSVYMLRPAMFAGKGARNHYIQCFRGESAGRGVLAARLKKRRMPCILPFGNKYLERRIEFVHVDDVARLIGFILRKNEPESRRLTILNVAGQGDPPTLKRCAQVAGAKILRVPGEWGMRGVLGILGKLGISNLPPEATDYFPGELRIESNRLREFLGPYYSEVIRYTVADAFADSFMANASAEKDFAAGA